MTKSRQFSTYVFLYYCAPLSSHALITNFHYPMTYFAISHDHQPPRSLKFRSTNLEMPRPMPLLVISLLITILLVSQPIINAQSIPNPLAICSLNSTEDLTQGEVRTCCMESRHFAVSNPTLCCDITASPDSLATMYVAEFCCSNEDVNGVPLTYSTSQCCSCNFQTNRCCADPTWVNLNNAHDVCCIDSGTSISTEDKARCCGWYRAGSGPSTQSCLRNRWLEWGFKYCTADCDPSSDNYNLDCCLRKGGFSEQHCCDARDYVNGPSTLQHSFNSVGCCSQYTDTCNVDLITGFGVLPTQNNVQAQIIPNSNPNGLDSISHLHCCMVASGYVDLGLDGDDERLWTGIGRNCCRAVKLHLADAQQYPYLQHLITKCLDDTNPSPPVTPAPCREEL